jgi:hypothetical protein
MPNRNYRSDDFRRYDVTQWYGAIRKELKQSTGFVGYKGEVLAHNPAGEAVKATSASKRVFFLFNPIVGVDLTGWDSKASGTVTVVSGAHEADTLIYNTGGTYAIETELTVANVTIDSITMAGVTPAAAGNMVFAVVDKLPASNRGALGIKVLDHPYLKA